ncbi:hypothetical protein LTR17_021575 [Elasticomyces elasticus]|nr:hypothetical protein LTR17_021575 [Elasticomyces elasticus]
MAAILATLASAKHRDKPIATFTLSDMPEEASSVEPVSFFLGPSDFFHLDPYTTITLPSDFPTSGNYIQSNKTIVVLPTPTPALQQRHELLQPRSTEQVLPTPTSPESVYIGIQSKPSQI